MNRRLVRTRTLVTALTMLTLLLAGCVNLPQTGGVQQGPDQEQAVQSDVPFDFNPPGPARGATRLDIVYGFLLSMEAAPQSTAVAREFLTDAGSARWLPEKSTLVYGTQIVTEDAGRVTMQFEETVRLDGRGRWLGDTSGGSPVSYQLDVVREKGQWRISNPPDTLIIRESHFDQRYEQYFLYFFDQTAQILVPEPVYLPTGEQAPTLLVRRLLRGPEENLLGVLRTFLPERTELELSVPVSRGGTAEVPLSSEILELNRDDLQMALAQLAWTLRQVSGIERMRVTVGGSPLDLPGEGSEQDVQAWTEYDPSIHWASQELFGLRGGHVVVSSSDGERRIEGRFGTEAYGLRSIGVDLAGEQVAGVTTDGSTVVVAPRGRGSGEESPRDDGVAVYSRGTDVLQPAWDIYGHIWIVDRTRDGARLTVVRKGAASHPAARGLSGKNIKAFAVSRDGTRLVAVVSDGRHDQLVLARVLRGGDGQVKALTPATALSVGAMKVDEIRDLGWRSPGSVALLAGPNPGSSQLLVALIDGSSAMSDGDPDLQTFRETAVEVVTAPSPAAPLYVGTSDGQLFELGVDGQWDVTEVKPGLRAPTFVG